MKLKRNYATDSRVGKKCKGIFGSQPLSKFIKNQWASADAEKKNTAADWQIPCSCNKKPLQAPIDSTVIEKIA